MVLELLVNYWGLPVDAQFAAKCHYVYALSARACWHLLHQTRQYIKLGIFGKVMFRLLNMVWYYIMHFSKDIIEKCNVWKMYLITRGHFVHFRYWYLRRCAFDYSVSAPFISQYDTWYLVYNESNIHRPYNMTKRVCKMHGNNCAYLDGYNVLFHACVTLSKRTVISYLCLQMILRGVYCLC